MGIGERIKHYRKAKGLTQAQVAKAVGISEAAIRHYEHNIRTPNSTQLAAIADALEINPAAISDYGIHTERDAIEILFRLEEMAGLKPSETDGKIVLVAGQQQTHSQISYALISWGEMRDKLDSGEITYEEYDEWKASFGNGA